MKRETRTALLACAMVCLLAQPAIVPAQQAPTAKTKHSLWRVQGKESSLYLLGSIHFFKEELYPLPAPIERAYEKSEVVVFEMDLDAMTSPEGQMKVLQAGRLPEGDSLRDHLSAETYAELQKYLKSAIGSGNVLDPLRPWVAALTLVSIELQKLGYNPEHGVDRHFFDRARRDKKKIVPLETMEFQLRLFAGLTAEEQESMLKETLAEISRFEKVVADLVSAWKTGDAEKLDALILSEMRQFPRLYEKLLTERNQQWLKPLEKLLAGPQDVFVVVGAGHLVGKGSVLELLRKQGYKIEQL